MDKLPETLRRESRCPRDDFLQRVRAGVIGAVLITVVPLLWHWFSN